MTELASAVLASSAGTSMSLKRVTATGRASGLLLSMTVRQAYRNDTDDTLETVYTFPLPWGAVLTGLSVEIAGRRLDGTVLPKRDAQARYEEAVGDGDAPIMVEKSSDALYTANLGNLKPGEDATIELRYVQLLSIEQGRVRLSIPTTIAPRYGDAARDASIREHEAVGASLSAAYPFEFSLSVEGALAGGAIASPTHAITVSRGEAGTRVRLARDGWLDRDLVLTFEGASGAATAHALGAPDGEGRVVLASFCPSLDASARASVAVKLLVDCSGSMGGDAIASAKHGLHRALAELRPGDRFSYSRFGSRVEHAFDGLGAAEPARVRTASRLVDATQADLGGTEMHGALASTFALGDEAADVLLVTDGAVWAIDAIVEAARASGHRVFAVGVGSAPAESLLRRLAESTGGACELVAPNESIEAAIGRMFTRLRVARAHDVRIDWDAGPAWSTLAPRSVFDGDTIHVVAGFASPDAVVTPRLSFKLDGDAVSRTLEARVEPLRVPVDAVPEGADEPLAYLLPRLAAARRIADVMSRNGPRGAFGAWARDLAVKHGLVTIETNLFLVHVRADADKASGLPALQKIEQMVAAGWGAVGSVRLPEAASAPTRSAYHDLSAPAVWRSQRGRHGASGGTVDEAPLLYAMVEDSTSAGTLVERIARWAVPPARTTPRRLLSTVRKILREGNALDALVRRLDRAALPDGVDKALRAIAAAGASRGEAWTIVLAVLARQVGDGALPGEAALRVLDARLAAMPVARREAGERVAERLLGAATLEAW
ncbi:MAG: VIT domain-containing protein [Burkholderiales bacterium]